MVNRVDSRRSTLCTESVVPEHGDYVGTGIEKLPLAFAVLVEEPADVPWIVLLAHRLRSRSIYRALALAVALALTTALALVVALAVC